MLRINTISSKRTNPRVTIRVSCFPKSFKNTPKIKFVSILYLKIKYTELQSFPTPFTIPTEHLKYTKEIL